MSNNEIQMAVDTVPRFKFVKTLSGETNVYSYEYVPYLGLVNNDPPILMIPALLFHMFNPCSLEDLGKLKIGDLVQVTADREHPMYKLWNPPDDYKLEDNYSKMFTIEAVELDAEGYPLIVGIPSI